MKKHLKKELYSHAYGIECIAVLASRYKCSKYEAGGISAAIRLLARSMQNHISKDDYIYDDQN